MTSESSPGFFSRHANKFKYLAGFVGGGYLLSKYAIYKFNQFTIKQDVDLQARSNLKRRFEQNLQDCFFVVTSLLPSLSDNLFQELNVELLTTDLKLVGAKDQKRLMWNKLKLQTFTRTLSSIYLLNLLTLFTTIQLSLLGRLVYLDSVIALNSHDSETDEMVRCVDENTERQYLTLSWYILNVGWKKFIEQFQVIVKLKLDGIPLNSPINHDALLDIIKDIRTEFENSKPSWDTFLMPAEGHEEEIMSDGGKVKVDMKTNPRLLELVQETRDFLESPDFNNVLSSCLDESFTLLYELFKPTFYDSVVSLNPHKVSFSAGEGSTDSLEDITSKSVALAGLLPLVSRSVHQILNGMPNVFVDVLSSNPKLKTYSVVVYSGWE
ncbi:Peroxin-3 [Globomyces pollinis-pini]|nr:Peroxin-3 [Globomyces pollinis-pini]